MWENPAAGVGAKVASDPQNWEREHLTFESAILWGQGRAPVSTKARAGGLGLYSREFCDPDPISKSGTHPLVKPAAFAPKANTPGHLSASG